MRTARLSFFAIILLGAAPFVAAQNNLNPHAIASGTHFLAALNTTLSTKDAKAGEHFEGITLEPLTAVDGSVLRAGAKIRGHVDKVEEAHATGRARLWLAFDDVKTPGGWMPIVAEVDDVPGTHSIRVDNRREGEIEAQSDKRKEVESAAAAGAVVGAATGVASRNVKDAAAGAAVGAVTAFLATSGLGQEVTLDKNVKLELTLERDLPLSAD